MFKATRSYSCYILFASAVLLQTAHLSQADTKRQVFTHFAPPGADKFFSRQLVAAAPLTYPVAGQYLTAAAPYGSIYAAPAISGPSQQAFRQQYQYLQAPLIPSPYQVFYPPHAAGINNPPGSGPIVFFNKFGADESAQQPGPPSSGIASYFPNWATAISNYFPSFGGPNPSEAEATTPAAAAEGGSQSGSAANNPNKKPEKLESSTEPQQQEAAKLESEKIVAEPEPQQTPPFTLVGYPQFFGNFPAAFPQDREPASFNAATKGAISSYLFYKDQPQPAAFQQQLQLQPQAQFQQQSQQLVQQQQQQPAQQLANQKLSDSPVNLGSAQVAYQRYLLLSKQRNEELVKNSATGTDNNPSSQYENNQSSVVNAAADSTQTKSSGDSILVAQVNPEAIAYAGIGGIAGASPKGTAISGHAGLASSAPRATAIAGTSNESPILTITPIKKNRI